MKTLDTETNTRIIIKTAHNDSVTINLPKILMLHKKFSLSQFNSQENNKQRTADVIIEWPDGDPEKKEINGNIIIILILYAQRQTKLGLDITTGILTTSTGYI